MSQSEGYDWKSATVIQQDEILEEYVFVIDEVEEGKLAVKNLCIVPDAGGVAEDSLVEFLQKKFPDYVFSQSRIRELRDREESAYRAAQEKTGAAGNPVTEGLSGEILLFIFTEGILGLPMISHKIPYKQNYRDEKKGSDGLFYGSYQGTEGVGFGEAKLYQKLKPAISNAIKSIYRFHGPDAIRWKKQELDIAPEWLSSDLNQEQIEYLSDQVIGEVSGFDIIHPILIGYEDRAISDLEKETSQKEELRNLIEEEFDSQDFIDAISQKLEAKDEYDDLRKYWLIFMFLPVSDAEKFKKKVRNSIYPYLGDSHE